MLVMLVRECNCAAVVMLLMYAWDKSGAALSTIAANVGKLENLLTILDRFFLPLFYFSIFNINSTADLNLI